MLNDAEQLLPRGIQPEAILVFEDIIRESAADTLAYFADQGVTVKIISGDSGAAVAAIATKLGLSGSNQYIDAHKLPDDEVSLQEYVDAYTIFGRVTPKHKQSLVKALQAKGHTVGMVGDGINDVLALKQADCSIAMANGSEASRTVSGLALMESNFASLPDIVNEGRKVINNIERVASLYLVKTLYSFILSVIFILIMEPYPFKPIQLSLVSSLMVGIPTFFLALETNVAKITGKFLDKVFAVTIPSAISIVLAILLANLVSSFANATYVEQSTLAFIVLGSMQFFILWRTARPIKPWKQLMLGLIFSGFMVAIFNPIAQRILDIDYLRVGGYVFAFIIIWTSAQFYRYFRTTIQTLFEINKDRLAKLFKKGL